MRIAREGQTHTTIDLQNNVEDYRNQDSQDRAVFVPLCDMACKAEPDWPSYYSTYSHLHDEFPTNLLYCRGHRKESIRGLGLSAIARVLLGPFDPTYLLGPASRTLQFHVSYNSENGSKGLWAYRISGGAHQKQESAGCNYSVPSSPRSWQNGLRTGYKFLGLPITDYGNR